MSRAGRTLGAMRGLALGVHQVPCPVCRVREGRPCRNRRGYLVNAHRPRVDAWVQLEQQDAAAPPTSR